MDAEQAAYNAEKLALVEKLLEKYKASAAENQAAIEQFDALKRQNAELLDQMSGLNLTAQSYQAKVKDLEEKLSAAGKADPAAMQQTQQLKARYQEAVKQVGSLESEVEKLEQENKNYSGQISDLKVAQENAMNSRPTDSNELETKLTELAGRNQQLTEGNQALERKNQQLSEDYSTLNGQYRDLSNQQQLAIKNNQRLSDQIAELNVSNNDFKPGEVSEVAAINAETPATPVAPTVDVSPYETKIAQLSRKNRQLVESNSDFKDENRSLSRQLASLKKPSNTAAVSENVTTPAVASLPSTLPAVATSTAADGTKSRWGVLTWLLPFLGIGLAIAFFVIVKEELHRPATATNRNK